MRIRKLSLTQQACLRAANVDRLICSYGNSFFIAGQKGVDYANAHPNEYHRYQRNTCVSLQMVGFLRHHPGHSGLGEYTITQEGEDALLKLLPRIEELIKKSSIGRSTRRYRRARYRRASRGLR